MQSAHTPITLGTSVAPSRRMRSKFLRDVAASHLSSDPGSRGPVTEAEVAALPPVVGRYLRFMRVVDRPRVWSFRARWTGTFRLATGAWMPCEAWQYNSSLDVARIFHMRVKLRGIMPTLVRDTYVRGKGRMLGRIFDAISVVDESDEQVATGELVPYLNDAILFAPSMLLGPATTWREVDALSFDVSLTDHDRCVTARVFVDENGAVTDFSTTDRFGTDPAHPKDGMVRARWTTPILGWNLTGTRPLPLGGKAVWHFASGDFAYAAFDVASCEIDVPPGADSGA